MTESKVKAKHDLEEDRQRVTRALSKMEDLRPSRKPCASCGSPDCWIGAEFSLPYLRLQYNLHEKPKRATHGAMVEATLATKMSYVSEILAAVTASVHGWVPVVMVDEHGAKHSIACGSCFNCVRQIQQNVEDPYLTCHVTGVPTETLMRR